MEAPMHAHAHTCTHVTFLQRHGCDRTATALSSYEGSSRLRYVSRFHVKKKTEGHALFCEVVIEVVLKSPPGRSPVTGARVGRRRRWRSFFS